MRRTRTLCLAGLPALAAVLTLQAGVIHRYSFSESPGTTTVKDSAGTADGILKGNGADFTGAGQLWLNGGTFSAAADAEISGYVDLPNHIINILPKVTLEAWITWEGSGSWQRVFDLGTSAGGENVVDGNGNYLFMSPAGPTNLRFAVRDPITGAEPTQITAEAPLDTGVEFCLTATYDPASNVARLFRNGVLIGAGTATVPLSSINDVNNWLGRSQWNDPMFAGSFNEFRIYDTALNPVEVAASCLSGPDSPSTDPAVLGAVQSVDLTVPQTTMTQGDTQSTIATVDFANMVGVSLDGVAGVTYTSDKPGVASVSSKGFIEALAAGTANVTLSYGGKSDTVTISVNPRQAGVAVAGKLWVDLRAEDVKNDTSVWPNRAGEGDFGATGAPGYEANVAGTGLAGVQFGGTDAYLGPATTADLDGASDRSIEVWAYNPSLNDEETLVAWAHRGGPEGSNLSFNYGANATYGAVGHWGSPDMGWSGNPAAGQWHYLVYAYDGAKTVRVYADGVLKTEKALGAALGTWPGDYIRLAAQANTTASDFDFGQSLSGYLALVRVHGGQLSAADVANNYLYGVELTPPGELQGVVLKLSASTLVGARAVGQATVTADYANRKYLDVVQYSTLASSDTSVLTVDKNGVYTALKTGTATLKATYAGKEATQTVTVVPPPATELKHRYSFNESPGSTTVKDSKGTADGLVEGNGADFTGTGQLVLPGGGLSAATPDVIAGYVNLPNHIINVLVNVSFEAWVTWNGSGSWQRIFDFGTSAGGEDVVNGNGNYLFLSPQGDANLRFAVRDPRTGGEPTQCTSTRPLAAGEEIYVAAVYNYTDNQARLYSNAVLVASSPAAVPLNIINDVNNWLGRSQWNDAMFAGSYNEFRIWEGGLTPEQVTANYTAGPNTVPSTETQPSLTVSLAGANVVIAWPAASTFTLESTLALGPTASWSTVDTSGAVTEGGQKKLTVIPSRAATLYRMKK